MSRVLAVITTIPTTLQAVTADQGQEGPARNLVDSLSMGATAGYVAPREGREVAQPRGPGGQARQDEAAVSDRPSMVPRDDADPTMAAMPHAPADDDRS